MGWIYPSEIVPLYIRNKAVSLSTFFNWAANFSLTFFTPPAFERIQWKVCPFIPPSSLPRHFEAYLLMRMHSCS
jgi:hypothetical protein